MAPGDSRPAVDDHIPDVAAVPRSRRGVNWKSSGVSLMKRVSTSPARKRGWRTTFSRRDVGLHPDAELWRTRTILGRRLEGQPTW